MRPWWDRLLRRARRHRALRRAHPRRGRTIPTASSRRPRSCWRCSRARRRARVVFPMHEPAGYPPANDRVLEAAADSDGRLVAYCRVDPRDGAVAEARRCLDAGARGIKLHPRAERVHALRARRPRAGGARARAPRAGPHPRGPRDPGAGARHRPALRRVPRRAADPRPRRDLGPRVALARAARPPEPADRHRVVGPGGHDGPVHARPAGQHPVGERLAVRAAADVGGDAAALAVQAGLGADAIRTIAGAQMERLLDGGDPIDAGPAPGPAAADRPAARARRRARRAGGRAHVRRRPTRPSRSRSRSSRAAWGRTASTRRSSRRCSTCWRATRRNIADVPGGPRIPPAARLLLVAMTVARTPDVPLPDLPDAPPPTREEAEP